MEAYYAGYRVIRGGNYGNAGSDGPASYRSYGYPGTDNGYNIGFRSALYL